MRVRAKTTKNFAQQRKLADRRGLALLLELRTYLSWSYQTTQPRQRVPRSHFGPIGAAERDLRLTVECRINHGWSRASGKWKTTWTGVAKTLSPHLAGLIVQR
jgi:hypothetical protein